jgi:hypothetical protein
MSSPRLHMSVHVALGVAAEDPALRRDATGVRRRGVAGEDSVRSDVGESHVRIPSCNERESAMAKNTTPFIAASRRIDCIAL